jgi:hypothetical protein
MVKPITITFGVETHAVATGFIRSIEMLLLLGLEEAEADSCSLYIYDPQLRTLSLRTRTGAYAEKIGSARVQMSSQATEWFEALDGPAIVQLCAVTDVRTESFPEVFEDSMCTLTMVRAELGAEASCLLNFGYRKQRVPEDGTLTGLTLLARSVAALLMEEAGLQELVELAKRAGKLEAELADIKIAERVNGFIESKARCAEVIPGLASHIDGVLGGGRLREELRQRVDELEEKVHDRRLINHAKARLQQVAMLTEDQAYLHMRNASRKTRKPLVVVAQEVLVRTAARAERKSA